MRRVDDDESRLKREMRVVFSKRAQPIWFHVLKWVTAIGVTAMLWRSEYLSLIHI